MSQRNLPLAPGGGHDESPLLSAGSGPMEPTAGAGKPDVPRVWRTSAAAEEVRGLKASAQIANRLRVQIVRGEVLPGEMFPSEKTLMAHYQVSRPTLREAFRILESDGLITVVMGARGGAQAKLPDLSVAARHIGLYLQLQGATLSDVLEARAEYEPICARLLAERCTPEGLAALRTSADRQQEAIGHGIESEHGYVQWVDAAGEFHDLIADHCGNKTLAAQARALRDVFDAHRRIGIRQRREAPEWHGSPDFTGNVVAACRKLIELVRAGAGSSAEEHWRAHLRYVADHVLRSRDGDAVISLFE